MENGAKGSSESLELSESTAAGMRSLCIEETASAPAAPGAQVAPGAPGASAAQVAPVAEGPQSMDTGLDCEGARVSPAGQPMHRRVKDLRSECTSFTTAVFAFKRLAEEQGENKARRSRSKRLRVFGRGPGGS